MAKRIEGVTEKILACAKEEFLTNGYENASLRVIAEKAGYTKGVIYPLSGEGEPVPRACGAGGGRTLRFLAVRAERFPIPFRGGAESKQEGLCRCRLSALHRLYLRVLRYL